MWCGIGGFLLGVLATAAIVMVLLSRAGPKW
jgi:hypothetical protein